MPSAIADAKAEAPPPAAAGSRRGILLVLLACFLLACMDAGSKTLAQDYSIIQILWVRFAVLAGIAWWLAHRAAAGARFRTRRPGLQILRSTILVTEIGLFIYGITILSLAEAHAIFAVTPLIVTALSVPLLGERVGIRRWTAIAIAFIGVLVILRPGLGVMQTASVVPLVCSFMFALYQILTRIVGRDDKPAVTLFYTAIIGLVGLTLIGPFFWTWPAGPDWALFLLVALLGAAGHYLLIAALRSTPAATIQPFNYTIMVWAALVGFVFFGDLPDLMTVVGSAIVVASGLYALARERRRPPAGDGTEPEKINSRSTPRSVTRKGIAMLIRTTSSLALLLGLGLGLSSAPALAQSGVCDLDDNGYVSRDEAQQCADQDYSTLLGDADAMDQETFRRGYLDHPDPDMMYTELDTDQDGTVSREEWMEHRAMGFDEAIAGNPEGMRLDEYEAWVSEGSMMKSQGADSQTPGGGTDSDTSAGSETGGGTNN